MSDSVNKSLETLFEKMENFVSTKTVVGDPCKMGDVTIVPLVDVSFGVGAGGGGGGGAKEGAGSGQGSIGGLGATISPTAVLVIANGTVSLVNIKNQDSVSKLIDMVPGVVSKLNFGPFKKSDQKDKEEVKFDDITITE